MQVQILGDRWRNLGDRFGPPKQLKKNTAIIHFTLFLVNFVKRHYKQSKTKIAMHLVCLFYDPKENLTLQIDSNKNGIGVVLLQNGKAIKYASGGLTAAEQKWS